MTIIHAEYLELRPLVIWDSWCLCCRLNNVKNNWYPIFICFPNSSNVRICSECLHWPESFRAHFTSLEKWQSALRLIFKKKLSNSRFNVFWGVLSFSATVSWPILRVRILRRHHWLHYYRESRSLLETARGFWSLHLGLRTELLRRWLRWGPIGFTKKIRHWMWS